MDSAIGSKTVTYVFARLMEGATEVKRSEFGNAAISHTQAGKRVDKATPDRFTNRSGVFLPRRVKRSIILLP